MPLGSGDFEAVSYNQSHNQSGYGPSIPRAARTGFSTHPSYPGSHFPAPSTSRHVPGAPNSLAPVAMGSARNAVATGPHATQDGMEAPARPSAKAGMSILFAGAIIGGLIGAVMHARQNAADAFAAAAQQQTTHESASDTLPAASSTNALPANVIAPPSKDGKDGSKDANAKLADSKDSDKADKTDADKKKKRASWTWKGPSKSTVTSHVATVDKGDDDDSAPAPAATAKGKKASNKDDDGYTIASAGGDSDSSDSAPAVKTKAADPPKADTSSKKKGADKAPKDDPAPVKKAATKGGDDAVNVLKAAMGATENAL